MRWHFSPTVSSAKSRVAGIALVCALALIVVSAGPSLGDGRNGGGALLVHTDDAVSWTGHICDQFDTVVPQDYTLLNTQTNKDAETLVLIWFIAAFHEDSDPGFNVVYFGNDHNLPEGYHNDWGMCSADAGIEIPDAGWPDYPAVGGVSVAYYNHILSDRLVPIYVFDVWGFEGAYYGSGINPIGGFAAFIEALGPPITDEIEHFGQLRWGEEGYNDYPQPPTSGACCYPDASCVIAFENECYRPWGIYQGDGTVCEPGFCGACCYWEQVDIPVFERRCVVTSEADCYDEESWGEHYVEVAPGVWYGSDWSYGGVGCAESSEEAPGKWFCFEPWDQAACCFLDGSCMVSTWIDCREEWQSWGHAEDCSPNPCPTQDMEFVRGDVNADDVLNTKDLLYFMGAIHMPDPPCWDAADFDDSGVVELTDLIGLLAFLYGYGMPPSPPFPECGFDPVPDDIGCSSFPPCMPGGIDLPIDDAEVLGTEGDAVRLRFIESLEGGRLVVPVELASTRNLLTFEFNVNFDDRVLRFDGLDASGLMGEELAFFSGRYEDGTGRIRIGGVPDLSGETPLHSGRTEVARLLFRVLDPDIALAARLEVTDAVYIAEDLSVIRATGEGMLAASDAYGVAGGSTGDLQLRVENPVRSGSVVSLDLPERAHVSLAIYNVAGQRLKELTSRTYSRGHHEFRWDGRTDTGQKIGPGIYYLRALVGEHSVDRSVVVVR